MTSSNETMEGQRNSLAARSDNSENSSSNASTIPITDRSNSSPSTETPLLLCASDALISDAPPALPPRPPNLTIPTTVTSSSEDSLPSNHPPHAFNNQNSRLYSEHSTEGDLKEPWWKRVTKKYVLLCALCGGVCVVLGILFGIIYFLLRHYTSSLHYFQTLPTYIPSIMLVLTGVMVLCFGRRCNRNGYMIKICGAFCLLSALVCVVVTVTTTVIHMNRLQTLRECVYQSSSKTCTCFAGILLDPSIHHDATLRYVFANAPNCGVIHGVLYSCLRAMFGLSVIGILVCIFSSMLVYQLLSHEKKKKYWEQLGLRCQHLYRLSPSNLHSSSTHCGCCFESSASSSAGIRHIHHSHIPSCQWPPNAALNMLDERYWPLSQNGLSSMAQTPQISTVERLTDNIYSPNPSTGNETVLTSLSTSQSRPEVVSRAISLRSVRMWFRRLSRSESSAPNGVPHFMNGSSAHQTALLPHHLHHHHHHHPPRLHQQLHQLWRYSIHSDSQYGFRVPPSSTSVSLPEPPLPQYQPPHHVLWGPPPPYSNSNINSNESNNNEISEDPDTPPTSSMSANNASSSATTTTTTITTSSNNLISRTTKSGLLLHKPSDYDETVKSAMHIYSKTSSLPSRRPKKPRETEDPMYTEIPTTARSLADITACEKTEEELEAVSVNEVRRKLKSLGLYKYHQRSKAARELAEIRQALNDLKDKSEPFYYAPSSGGGSSTTENKYETIGKSILPYRIPGESRNPAPPSNSSIPSHYSQISPLHGRALPPGATSSAHNSPVKSYFKDILTSKDPKSLPIEALQTSEPTSPQRGRASSDHLSHSISSSMGAQRGFHNASMEILTASSADHRPPLPASRPRQIDNPAPPPPPPPSQLKNSGSDSNVWKVRDSKKTPVQQCVYLRPEQNIPDVFGNAAFKPITDESKSNYQTSDNCDGSAEENSLTGDTVISRDDIVVTMRSVNV